MILLQELEHSCCRPHLSGLASIDLVRMRSSVFLSQQSFSRRPRVMVLSSFRTAIGALLPTTSAIHLVSDGAMIPADPSVTWGHPRAAMIRVSWCCGCWRDLLRPTDCVRVVVARVVGPRRYPTLAVLSAAPRGRYKSETKVEV